MPFAASCREQEIAAGSLDLVMRSKTFNVYGMSFIVRKVNKNNKEMLSLINRKNVNDQIK